MVYEFLAPFGGSGGQSLGLLAEEVRLLGHVGRFRCRGSIDLDPIACADYERFTGSRAWQLDVQAIEAFWSASMFRAAFGERAPDVVIMSPPCKGASRLLSSKKARTAPYRQLNRLATVWCSAMLDAWGAAPPALILLENVPGLPHRARAALRSLRSLLRAAGYVFDARTHDCGELGGLAQHRERYLLVARLPARCSSFLYQPPKRRVRGIGEVLSPLPVPATPEAARWGDLHVMPRLTWRNWLRLALIPAGGDWRDLAGVLEGRARREVFRRHAVERWDEPAPAITGPGGHSVEAVADPRVAMAPSESRHWNKLHVDGWTDPALTVIGKEGPANGGASVADPRVDAIRVPTAYDAGYGVLGWSEAARTIAGSAAAGTGAYAVADPRPRPTTTEVRVLSLEEAMALDLDPKKAPPFVPVIIAEDGTWHRPLTLLELAVIQGYPAEMRGEPIAFGGTRTEKAVHIGNSIPPPAAAAIGRQMLVALMESALGAMSLSSLSCWVEPAQHAGRKQEETWNW